MTLLLPFTRCQPTVFNSRDRNYAVRAPSLTADSTPPAVKRGDLTAYCWLFLIAALLSVVPLHAATIDGQVFDNITGNPIADANVMVIHYTNTQLVSLPLETLEEHLGTSTDMAGRFSFEVFDKDGIYTLRISHVGYKETEIETQPSTFIEVELTPESVRLSEVVVTAGRGTPGKTPGTLSNIDRSLVELAYGAQDVPMLAAEVPGAVAFSWSGSSVGASQLKIRGFDTDRLSVTVNGVPMNDPEDHSVYWQDTPDFISNTYDIQVERGVSSFLSGPAGLGGGLNLATSDAISKPELNLSLQAGSFNTLRRTFAYRTGVVNERYNFTGRLSQVSTDGYRDHTGAKTNSYFLSATRYDPNMVTTLQLYGGQEEMDAYWWGIDKNTLEENRKANYSAWYEYYHPEYFPYYYDDERDSVISYHDERDYFQQPHYILHNRWRLSPELELNQSLFWIQGEGFYEEWKLNRKFYEYNLTPFDKIIDEDGDGVVDTVITINHTDLIRRKYVTKDQIGWMPRLNWKLSDAGMLGIGLELRSYRSDHYGRVMWARDLPEGVKPMHEWYRWEGDKDYLGGYANLDYQLNDKLKINSGLQVRRITYEVNQHKMGAFTEGYNYELDWLFINPRLGAAYQLDDETSLYASLSGAGREPIDEQIMDADNPDDIPKVDKYDREEINPERMWDVEIGGWKHYGSLDMGANLYAMFFTDEIVSTGFNSVTDEEVFENAPTSRHIGIELEAKWRNPLPGISVSGNISIGQATLGNYKIHHVSGLDDNWNPIRDTLNLDGNRIAGFPDVIGNLRLTYTRSIFTGSLHVQQVGKQYMDNREDDEASLDPYTLLDGVLRVKLKDTKRGMGVDIELRGMNLLDLDYEPYGIVDVEYGTPYYVPASGRSYLVGVTLRM
ncbi:MAG: TonB-dependent receptor [Candidatus Hatepunaea meridiana]|nr:TonB-dependent receptor [Candidatus Hatepunaea meridiana]